MTGAAQRDLQDKSVVPVDKGLKGFLVTLDEALQKDLVCFCHSLPKLHPTKLGSGQKNDPFFTLLTLGLFRLAGKLLNNSLRSFCSLLSLRNKFLDPSENLFDSN